MKSCHLGEQVYIGQSACISEKRLVGANTIKGMGSVVVKDIQINVIVIGNPARPMESNDDKRVFK